MVIKRALGAAAQALESPGPCSLPRAPHPSLRLPRAWSLTVLLRGLTQHSVTPRHSSMSHSSPLSQRPLQPARPPRRKNEPSSGVSQTPLVELQKRCQPHPSILTNCFLVLGGDDNHLSILTQSVLPYLNIPIVPTIILKNCVCMCVRALDSELDPSTSFSPKFADTVIHNFKCVRSNLRRNFSP